MLPTPFIAPTFGTRGIRAHVIARFASRRRHLIAATAALVCGALVLAGSASRASANCRSVCTGSPDGLQLYEVDASQTFVSGTTVTLTDAYITNGVFTLDTVKRLGAPGNVSGDDPTAPADPDHLVGYTFLTTPNVAPVVGLSVSNRFGTFTAALLRPVKLYVPGSKSLTMQPPPLTDPTADHFLCYDVHTSFAARPMVTVVDQFGNRTLKLLQVAEVCDAVDKNGEGIPTPNQWLTCYTIRVQGTPNHPGWVFVNTQFGQDEILLTHPDEVCVASTVGP